MFLYSTGIEELAVIILNSKNIAGYKIPRMVLNNETDNQGNNEENVSEIKKTLYADGTDGILENTMSIDFYLKNLINRARFLEQA
jgi:hypothetical protein